MCWSEAKESPSACVLYSVEIRREGKRLQGGSANHEAFDPLGAIKVSKAGGKR